MLGGEGAEIINQSQCGVNAMPGNPDSMADAILELFRKRDKIDVFNKKALYIYIREMIDVKTPKITKISNVLHKIFKEKYMFYLEHGYFPGLKG